jgi:Zn-dependent protease
MNWWIYDYYQHGEYALLVSQIFWVLFSITLHELAHGWAAIWQGDDTPRRYNRMTINPIVHMGQFSIIMFLLVGIAWGLMPVDPSRFRWRRRGRIVVSGAGPAMNIVLAVVALTAAALWQNYGTSRQPLADNMRIFLLSGGVLNIALAIFNLLPIPPLDGADILRGLSLRFYVLYQRPQVQMASMFVFLVLFMSGLFSFLFSFASFVSHQYVDLVSGFLP